MRDFGYGIVFDLAKQLSIERSSWSVASDRDLGEVLKALSSNVARFESLCILPAFLADIGGLSAMCGIIARFNLTGTVYASVDGIRSPGEEPSGEKLKAESDRIWESAISGRGQFKMIPSDMSGAQTDRDVAASANASHFFN